LGKLINFTQLSKVILNIFYLRKLRYLNLSHFLKFMLLIVFSTS